MYIDIKSWLTIISERNDVTLNGNQQIEQKQWRSFINELSKLVVFDQPFEKYANVKMGSFSQNFGVNIKKCLSCHSLVSKIFINLFVLGAWFSYPIKSKTMSTLPQTNSPWKRPICYSFMIVDHQVILISRSNTKPKEVRIFWVFAMFGLACIISHLPGTNKNSTSVCGQSKSYTNSTGLLPKKVFPFSNKNQHVPKKGTSKQKRNFIFPPLIFRGYVT